MARDETPGNKGDEEKHLSDLNPVPLVRRPISAARQAANQANSKKSTGPRTDVGKEISSNNPLGHGLSAARVVMASEDLAEFGAFRDRFLREADPQGPAEQLLAERIVDCAWRLRRLGRIEAEAFQFLYDQDLVGRIEQRAGRVPTPTTRLGANVHYAATHGVSIKNLHRYEVQLERSLFAALTNLRQLQADRRQPG